VLQVGGVAMLAMHGLVMAQERLCSTATPANRIHQQEPHGVLWHQLQYVRPGSTAPHVQPPLNVMQAAKQSSDVVCPSTAHNPDFLLAASPQAFNAQLELWTPPPSCKPLQQHLHKTRHTQ
jgi:hypothetical protein